MTQPTYSLGSEPPTTHLKNGKGRNTHCRQRLQTIGNTGLLSNSLSIKVFKIFYAFDIAIKQKFLIDDYGIELLHISIETPVEPYHRWKAELRRKTKGLSNIVYINCYKDHGVLRPLICGVTKTGDKGTVDFNFNKYENDGKMSDKISGRMFLKENGIN